MSKLVYRGCFLLVGLLSLPLALWAQRLDPAFHVPEIYTEAAVRDAALMPNGQIIVAGRFTRANGQPATMAPNGQVAGVGSFMPIMGQPATALARFDAAGTLDATFQQNVSGAMLRVGQVIPLANGQALVLGDYQAGTVRRQQVFRLNANGTLDPTFTLTFSDPYPYPRVIQILAQPDGRVLVLGFLTRNNDSAELIRLLPDGSRDPSFQVELEAFSQSGTSMLLLPDGKVMVGGTLRKVNGTMQWWFARLNPNGSTDTSFQPGITPGETLLQPYPIVMTPDANGSLLVGGSYINRIAGRTQAVFRLLSSGALDPSFTLDPSLAGRNCQQLLVQPDGAILALFDPYKTTNGQIQPLPFSTQLVRLLPNGNLDPSFQPGSADHMLSGLRGLPTGRFLTWGSFSNFAGQRRTLALLQPNGELDASFAPLLQSPGSVQQILLQADGKLLLSGHFSSIDGHLTDRLARLLPTGEPDRSFSWRQPASASWGTSALAVQADGRVLLSGTTQWSNVSTGEFSPYQSLFTRLTVTGASDASFVPAVTLGSGSGYGIALLAEQADGKLLVGGSIVDGLGRANLTRLTPTGGVDATYSPPAAHPIVYGGILQANGALACLIPNAANTGLTLERLLANGQPDPAFKPDASGLGYRVFADPTTGGYLDLTGALERTSQVIGRLTATGARVADFTTPFRPVNGPATPYSGVNTLLVQPDGSLLVGGYMQQNSAFGSPPTLLARLTPTGQTDPSFNPTLVFSPPAAGVLPWDYDAVEALALQPDGALLVGGSFLTAAGRPVTGLIRILAPTALAARTSHATGDNLRVWPVPARDVLHLSLAATDRPQRVSLLNTLGKTVRTQAVSQPNVTLSTAGLAAGWYVLRVEYAAGGATRSVVLE